MAAIIQYLKTELVFDPNDIKAMSMALDDVCKSLRLPEGDPARETIAERIIALASAGERSPTVLRDRVLKEAGTDKNAAPPERRFTSTQHKGPSSHY